MMTVENRRVDLFNIHRFVLYSEEAFVGLVEYGQIIGLGG